MASLRRADRKPLCLRQTKRSSTVKCSHQRLISKESGRCQDEESRVSSLQLSHPSDLSRFSSVPLTSVSSGASTGVATAALELGQRAKLQLSNILTVLRAVSAFACSPTRQNIASLPAGRPRLPPAVVVSCGLAGPMVDAGHLTGLEAVAAAGGGALRPRADTPLQGAHLRGAVPQ